MQHNFSVSITPPVSESLASECSLAGQLYVSPARVAFVPNNTDVQPLLWDAAAQRFAPATTSDVAELVAAGGGIKCVALYGVLPLGAAASVLLYARRAQVVGKLPLRGAAHRVYRISSLECLRLPGSPSHSKPDDGGSGSAEPGRESPAAAEDGAVCEESVRDYLRVAERFCASCTRRPGDSAAASHLYFSDTVDLSLGAVALMTRAAAGEPPTDADRCAHDTFCWNSPLLERLGLSGAGDGERAAASVNRYAPSVIRGVVAMQEGSTSAAGEAMVTRMSWRWSGTRYNRRGLEPGASGVVANMGVTTIWTWTADRMECYDTLRGSVPRRWSQTADLSYKPPLRLSGPAAAEEEVRLHFGLVARLFPAVKMVVCLDTMSSHGFETPLSEGFALGIAKLQQQQQQQHESAAATAAGTSDGAEPTLSSAGTPSPHALPKVVYCHFDMKKEMKRLPSFESVHAHLCLRVKMHVKDCETPLHETSVFTLQTPANGGGGPVWEAVQLQSHLHRVNCLDCLDRTNLAQAAIAIGECRVSADAPLSLVRARRLQLFEAQGRAISSLYTNTPPHYLRYMSVTPEALPPKWEEGALAARRWFNNCFRDGRKQDGVSLVTRQHRPELYPRARDSPFHRDLSVLNTLVLVGVATAAGAVVHSLARVLTARGGAELLVSFALLAVWLAYLLAVAPRLLPYRVTLTNRALLTYNGN